MPKPVGSQRYMPGLDGLRALAVIAVIAYHLDLSWAPGGLLGVGVFFTLSGYLITDLLVGRYQPGRPFSLKEFWSRRARRLLPGLVVMLACVTAWVALLHRHELGQLGGNLFAASLYASNWWTVAHHGSYFARFAPPSPLDHLWSLAVEEQFYLAWPLLLLLGLRFVPERSGSKGRPRLALLTLAGGGASAVAMALLYHPGTDPTRVYDGTDTRAFGLLIGAALALWWPSRRLRPTVPDHRRTRRHAGVLGLDVAAAAGLAAIAVLIVEVQQYSEFLYPDGMVLLSVATCGVLLALASPRTVAGRVLGWGPLRWVGERSYGIYLWHFPIIVLTTPAGSHRFVPARAVLQVAATVVVAAASWRWVEDPVRTGRSPAHRPAQPAGPTLGRLPRWVPFAGALLALAPVGLALNTIGPAADALGASSVISSHSGSGTARPAATPSAVAAGSSAVGAGAGRAGRSGRSQVPAAAAVAAPPVTATLPPSKAAARSSCTSVADLGDSTSETLILPSYVPDPAKRLAAQFDDVGATQQYLEIYGSDSIVEHLPIEPDGYAIATQLVSQGFHGCWVMAMGTNDAANIAGGSNVGAAERIARMMSVIGKAPVLWVNVITLLDSTPYANSNMQSWNQALLAACAAYPNLRVYDWASVARPEWFLPDGIHYGSVGSAIRAHDIATALAEAFPAGRRWSRGCVVH